MSRMPLLAALLGLALAAPANAQENVLNLYSARHYQTDEALYANFTRQTGIRINRIEAKEEELLERLRNEGASSPADVLITVDAARLSMADGLGLFAPVNSPKLEQRIPAHLRAPDWISFSVRARVIVYNKSMVQPAEVANYEDLANPRHKGKVCSRSGSHPYNLSLLSSIIAHQGEARAEEWARGVVANFARPPRGGDTDQIKSVAAGECAITVSNTYYLVRMMRSDKPADRQVMERVGIVWPNQQNVGTHINVSGGGILKHAPHKQAAASFLDYLTSDEAQAYFANGNNEWPAVPTVPVTNPALESLGKFKADTLPVATLASHIATAQRIYDRVGWK